MTDCSSSVCRLRGNDADGILSGGLELARIFAKIDSKRVVILGYSEEDQE